MTKILILDDDVALLELFSIIFEMNNYKIATCSKVKELPACIKNFAPDIVLMDVLLRGYDGMLICRKIKNQYDIPIILLSASPLPLETTAQFYADEVIYKPFDITILLSTINKILLQKKQPI